MWLDDLVTPNGPEAPSVYWFRRGVVGVILIVLAWLLWPSGGGDKDKTSGTGTSTAASSSPSPQTTATTPSTGTGGTGGTGTSAATPCKVGDDINISADADGSDYNAGVLPKITISIRNVSAGATAHPCTLNTADRFLTITSGSDQWYSSKLCSTGATPTITINAGQTVTSTYTWNRKRQSTDCAATGADAGEGTYLAKAHYGSTETQGAIIRLH